MTRRVLALIGLAAPYRFDRTIAVLAAAGLGLVVMAAGLHFWLADKLRVDTPRELFFIYMAVLIVTGLLLAPFPRVAAIPLSLAAIEIGLGFGSALLYSAGVGIAVVMPLDTYLFNDFRWHPLLQIAPSPTPPFRLWPRDSPVHNAMGLRGRDRSAEELRDRIVVEAFGGSSTYDVDVADGETWPEVLEQILGEERYAVLNRGAPAYSTVENTIQTAFYPAPYGETPRCAIYYVGWNDLRSSHNAGLDPGYADHHMRSQLDAVQARRLDGPMRFASPLLLLIGRLVVLAADTARPVPKVPPGREGTGPDPSLEAIYRRNLHTISAINRERGIRTLWITQLVRRDRLEAGGGGRQLPLIPDEAAWPLLQRLAVLLKQEAAAMGDVHVEMPNDRFGAEDFFDVDHFVAAGSRKFAALLAPVVAETCGGDWPKGR